MFFAQQVPIILNLLVRKHNQKHNNDWHTHIMTYMNSCKLMSFCSNRNSSLWTKNTRFHITTVFVHGFSFVAWWLHSIAFPYCFGRLSSIRLHILSMYPCVPRTGFSADISIDNLRHFLIALIHFLPFSFIPFWSIVVHLILGFCLDF